MPVEPDEYSQNAGSSGWVAAVANESLLACDLVGEFLVAVRVLAGDDDMLEIGHPPDHVLDHGQQRFGNEQHAGAAIRQHIGVLIGGEQRIERHRHDAGTDRAQKHRRKIRRVQHDHGDAFFAADAKPAQHVGDAAALLLQAAIGQLGNGVGEGEFVAAALVDIAVEQPGHRIVGTAAHATSLQPGSSSVKHATTLLPNF